MFAYLYNLKPPAGWMLLGSGIKAARKKLTNLKKCNYSCRASISIADVKNMGNCENSNKKLFFDVANSRHKIKSTVF